MNYAPIINSKLKLFKKNYGLEKLEDNTAFEFFINNLVLRMYQPEAFSAVNDLFDQVCVGGQEDTGIDGIAIKINGVFISTKEDVDGIIKNNPRIKIEFIFIQAKNKSNLDSGEFGKFMSGVTDFLSEQQCEPHNEKIGNWIALKDYLCSEEILVHWETSPNIKLFYAYTGDWQNDVHKKIDAFCDKVYQEIKDISKLIQHLNASISLFNTIKEKWIREKGSKYKYAIKDNADFTKYMLTYIRGGNTDKVLNSISESNLRGTVVTVKRDRNGLYYGYIKHSPSDVFIHEDDNPSIRFYDLAGKDVVYYITTSSLKTNTSRGKIKYVVKDGD